MTSAARITAPPKRDYGQRLVLGGIDWDSYEKFLDAVGDRSIRLTYKRGNMEIAVPRYDHETWKRCIDRLIIALGVVLGFEVRGAGSATLRRADVQCGVEPDECYYIQNESAVRNIQELDLTSLPPPDLALEVDITNSSIDRLEIYAELRVPEIWRFDGEKTFIYHLLNDDYHSATVSLAVPVLTARHIQDFLDASISLSDTEMYRFAPQWVKKHILPLWRKRRGKKPTGTKRGQRPMN
jgi:Uma2 family endonuclease